MKRFAVTAALAAVLSLGLASSASAQIVYGYSVPRGTGVMSGGTYLSPGISQGYSSFYSPYTGMMMSRTYGQNFMGQAYGIASGYNPWTGMSYQRRLLPAELLVQPLRRLPLQHGPSLGVVGRSIRTLEASREGKRSEERKASGRLPSRLVNSPPPSPSPRPSRASTTSRTHRPSPRTARGA